MNRLRRLRSAGFSTDHATGDARLDTHLWALDAALVGAAAVRRPTVMEARDFLLELRDRALRAGKDDAAAAVEALAALGPLEALAREQRANRAAVFRRVAIPAGLGYAGLMLLVSLLRTGVTGADWPVLAGVFAVHALLFGTGLGYWVAYLAKQAEPTVADAPAADAFSVRWMPTSAALAWGLAAVFGLGAGVLAAGLAGLGPVATWARPQALALLLLNAHLALGELRAARFRARVEDGTLYVEGLRGQQRIPQAAISGTAPVSLPLQLLLPGMGRSYWVHWRDERGRERRTRVSSSPELVHGDRLLAWLEGAARANRGA